MQYGSNTKYYIVQGFHHKNGGISPAGKFYGAYLREGAYYFVTMDGVDAAKASRAALRNGKVIRATALREDDALDLTKNMMGDKEEGDTLNELDKPVQLNPNLNKDNTDLNPAHQKSGIVIKHIGDDGKVVGQDTKTNRYVQVNDRNPQYKVGETVDVEQGKLVGNFGDLGDAVDSDTRIQKPIKPLGNESKEHIVRYLNEEGFKEGTPSGDGKMENLGGEGVAKKSLGKISAENGSVKTTDMGKEWPRKHKNTGGSWETEQESPTGNAPEPNNERMKKISGNMGSELGQNSKQKNKGHAYEPLPNTGHEMEWKKVGGEGAPNVQSYNENWDPDGISTLMEENSDTQTLFDTYAKRNTYVTVEDFNVLCNAYGIAPIDESILSALMANNQEYLFVEGQDYSGKFWYTTFPEQNQISEDGIETGGKANMGMPANQNVGIGDKLATGRIPGRKAGRLGVSRLNPSSNDGADGSNNIDGGINPVESRGRNGKLVREMDHDVPPGEEDEDDVDPMSDVDPAGVSHFADEIDDEETMEHGHVPGDLDGGMGGGMDDDMGEEGMEGDVDDMDGDMGEVCADGSCDEIESLGAEIGARVAREIADQMGMGDINGDMGSDPMDDMGGMGDEEGMGDMGSDVSPDDGVADDLGNGTDMMADDATTTGGLAMGPMGGIGGSEDEHEDPLMKSDEDDEEEGRGRPRPFEHTSSCPSCETIMDEIGCPNCGLIRETHEYGMDGSKAKADEHGTYTTDDTKPLGKPNPKGDIGKPQEGEELRNGGGRGKSNGSDKVKELRSDKLGNNSSIKNKMGSNTLESIKKNVSILAGNARKFLSEAAKAVNKPGKFKPHFTVKAEGVKPRKTTKLSEAMTDVEELIQACGTKNVDVEVSLVDSSGGIAFKQNMPLVTITPRGALASEGKVLFRFPEVATAYAKAIVESGITCRTTRHNWGAAVSGKIPNKLILNAYNL